jgi:hypothetical protein
MKRLKLRISFFIQRYSIKIKNGYSLLENIIRKNKLRFQFNNLYKKGIIHEMGVNKNSPRKLIISITSYPKRFNNLHWVLYSLLTQTIKPNKVILVLSKKEVKSEKEIPNKILFLRKIGLKIKFVKENYKSYNKLIFTLKDFPEYNIITVDDDILYPKWFLEKLYYKHKEHPKEIICYRTHLIKKRGNNLDPYSTWMNYDMRKYYKGLNLLPTGVSGILYPPNSLNKEVFNSKIFLNICPLADDIWFKAMSLLNKTNCRRVFKDRNFENRALKGTQEQSLGEENVINGKNDEQIKRVFNRYNIDKYLN